MTDRLCLRDQDTGNITMLDQSWTHDDIATYARTEHYREYFRKHGYDVDKYTIESYEDLIDDE